MPPGLSPISKVSPVNVRLEVVNGEPKGIVPLDRDGNPCKHRFEETQLGRCWYQYKCANGCGESYQIDSGD